MIIYKFERKYLEEWNRFIEDSKTPLFIFKREFMEYHSDRFVDSSLLFFKEGKLVAVLPASIDGENLVSHGGLTYGGLVFLVRARSELIKETFVALKDWLIQNDIRKLIYKAIPHIFHEQGNEEDLYFLHNTAGGVLVRRDLGSYVILKNRMKLSKGRKALISKARKLDLVVEKSNEWEKFHEILRDVLDRHGVAPVHSANELLLLGERFPENISLNVVKDRGRMIAGSVLFIFKKTVHTQYMCVSDEGKEKGALDLLIESVMIDFSEKGFEFLNFGISTENAGKYLNQGLISQKEGFGGRGMVLDHYEITLDD